MGVLYILLSVRVHCDRSGDPPRHPQNSGTFSFSGSSEVRRGGGSDKGGCRTGQAAEEGGVATGTVIVINKPPRPGTGGGGVSSAREGASAARGRRVFVGVQLGRPQGKGGATAAAAAAADNSNASRETHSVAPHGVCYRRKTWRQHFQT